MAVLPRKVHPPPAQNLNGAMELVETFMPPHAKFPPILTLNKSVPTRRMDRDELRVVPFTIKSCIFVLFFLLCQVCVLDCAMDLLSKLESTNKTK